jgi:hypothetical protein
VENKRRGERSESWKRVACEQRVKRGREREGGKEEGKRGKRGGKEREKRREIGEEGKKERERGWIFL